MARTHRSNATAALLERAMARMPKGEAPIANKALEAGRRVHRMLEAMEGVATNRYPTETEEGHALRVSKVATSLKTEAGNALQALNRTLNEGSANLRTKIAQATGFDRESPHAAEIRAAFRPMSHGKKLDLIKEAMAAKDTELLAAVLAPHPFLSGIDPKFRNDMRNSFEAQMAPELVEEFEALIDLDSEVAALIRTAERAADEAVQPDYITKVKEAAERAERAAAEHSEAFAPPMAAE